VSEPADTPRPERVLLDALRRDLTDAGYTVDGLEPAGGDGDGELTVGQIVGALGSLLGVAATEVAADVVPSVRGLVLDGLLAPA
jgi:hypothetical protein